MYSIKEKMKLLRELHNPEHVDADLRLLREVSPQNDLLRSPIVNAVRSAEKILYTLLDQTTAEKIRLNRRGMEVENKPENELNNENSDEKKADNSDPEQPTSTEKSDGHPAEGSRKDNSDGNTGQGNVARQLQDKTNEQEDTQGELNNIQAEPENSGEAHQDGDAEPNDVPRQLQDKANELEETLEELESTQAELEGTQNELEETRSELETIKEELETQKKSEPDPRPDQVNSKKKTSTRKSTGKISSTKTSKSRR